MTKRPVIRSAVAAALLPLAACTVVPPANAPDGGLSFPAGAPRGGGGPGVDPVGLGGRPDAGPGSASDTRVPRRDPAVPAAR